MGDGTMHGCGFLGVGVKLYDTACLGVAAHEV
jgi:hypothetical protein